VIVWFTRLRVILLFTTLKQLENIKTIFNNNNNNNNARFIKNRIINFLNFLLVLDPAQSQEGLLFRIVRFFWLTVSFEIILLNVIIYIYIYIYIYLFIYDLYTIYLRFFNPYIYEQRIDEQPFGLRSRA